MLGILNKSSLGSLNNFVQMEGHVGEYLACMGIRSRWWECRKRLFETCWKRALKTSNTVIVSYGNNCPRLQNNAKIWRCQKPMAFSFRLSGLNIFVFCVKKRLAWMYKYIHTNMHISEHTYVCNILYIVYITYIVYKYAYICLCVFVGVWAF